jgi:integrase/recombinase XerD
MNGCIHAYDPSMIPAPLDRFVVPPELDGRTGTNRCDTEPQIGVLTDVEAVSYFLEDHTKAPNTRRKYQVVVERFVLWSILAEKKPISSVGYEDFYRYQSFLNNPAPGQQWVATRNRNRHTDEWRPFEGPVLGAAQKTELRILNILFAYLVDVRYLKANPVPRSLAREINRTSPAPAFKVEMWNALRESIEAMPRETRRQVIRYARARWLAALFSTTSLKLSQVVRTQMNGFFRRRSLFIGDQWWLATENERGDVTAVPVTAELVEELKRYRVTMECEALPYDHERTPLIIPAWGEADKQLSESTLGQFLKKILGTAAKHMRATGAPEFLAVEFENASARWLRQIPTHRETESQSSTNEDAII